LRRFAGADRSVRRHQDFIVASRDISKHDHALAQEWSVAIIGRPFDKLQRDVAAST